MVETIARPVGRTAPSGIDARSIFNAKLSSIGIAMLFLFLLFENPLEGYMPLLGYHDEFLFAVTALLAVLKLAKSRTTPNSRALVTMILLLAVLSVGLLGSFFSGYQQSTEAVLKDVLAFVKFPITLTAVLYLTADRDNEEALGMCTVLSKAFIVICFIFSVINTVAPTEVMSHDVRQGIASFKFLFSHPTFLVLSLVLAFAMVSRESSRIDTIKVMCLIALALTMRDKAFGFIGLVVALWLFKVQGKKRILPYLAIAAVVVLVVAMPKIELYNSYSNSPREAMYTGAFQLASSFFPFGSGFGTFASSLSGEYYSGAYLALGLSTMQGLTPESHAAAGDSGIAYYIGQFGVLGLVLTIAIGVLLCRELFERACSGTSERFAVISLLGYLAIALTVEATLTNASGVSAAIALALISSTSPKQDLQAARKR